MPGYALDARNPFLVLLWSFGLFMLMHGHQYLGALLASWADRVPFDSLMSGKHETSRSVFLRGLLAIVVGLPLIWLSSTVLWNRPLAWMGLDFRWGWLLLGLGFGVLAPFLVVVVLSRMKLAEVRLARNKLANSQILSAILGMAMMAIFAGVSEEIVFRGMMGLELSLSWGWPLSILVTGAVFGVVHLVGQLKTLTLQKTVSILVSSIAVSFLFISLYRYSGSLWLPIGFHITWNYAHSILLGLEMNGKPPLASCLQTTLKSTSWIAGGEAGMEQSIPAIAVYCLLGVLFTLL